MLAKVEAAFTPRATPLSWQRAVGLLLALVVLAGGIYPALYQGQLPHAHIFIGGPPPVDWEDHQHENPLDYLFGPTNVPLRSDVTTPAASIPGEEALPRWSNGRVISVYAAPGLILVLTVLGYAVIASPIHRFVTLRQDFELVNPDRSLSPQITPRPVTPPPRALA